MKNFLLSIDSGNSKTKYRYFQRQTTHWDQLESNQATQEFDYDTIISDVSEIDPQLKNQIKGQLFNVSDYIEDNKFLDMPTQYSKTVGADRIVQAYYLYKNLNKNIILIDAGTFITVDIISPNGFHGGYIIPGVTTALESYSRGKNLPKLNRTQFEQYVLTGTNHLPSTTTEAILAGVLYQIKYFISQIATESKIEKLIFTGGDASLLINIFPDKTIKSDLNFQALCFLYEHLTGMKQ